MGSFPVLASASAVAVEASVTAAGQPSRPRGSDSGCAGHCSVSGGAKLGGPRRCANLVDVDAGPFHDDPAIHEQGDVHPT